MSFINPKAFILIIFIFLFIFYEYYRYKNSKKDLVKIGGEWRAKRLLNVFTIKWFFKTLTFAGFLFCSIVALSGPCWGHKSVIEERQGLDIVFAVDVSKSMLVEDLQPNRLEKAKLIMKDLVDGFSGSRIGVVIFKGRAFKSIPLTEDSVYLKSFINNLGSDLITSIGTNVTEGLENAYDSFPEGKDRNRFVVLLSDGGSISGKTKELVVKELRKGIPLYVIGFGSEEGGRIPSLDDDFIKNKSGKYILSKIESKKLEELARVGNAKYFDAKDSRILSKSIKSINSRIEARIKNIYRFETVNHYKDFVLSAIIFLLLYISVGILRWKNAF